MIGGYMARNEFLIDDGKYLPLLQDIYGENLREVVLIKSDAESIQLVVFVDNFNDEYAKYDAKCQEIKFSANHASSNTKKLLFTTWNYANYIMNNMPFCKEIKKCKTVWMKNKHE